MKVLAIDPGSEKGLGWCLLDSEGLKILYSGVLFIERPKYDKHRDRSMVWRAVLDLLVTYGSLADYVAYEDVMRHSSVWAAHLYGGQIAHIQWWCHINETPFLPVPVATVKRMLQSRAAGRDKAKAQVAAAHALGYTQIKDHNEADALGIALGALWLMRRTGLEI